MLKDDFDDPAKHPNNVRIVAVQKIDSYIKCLKCNSKMAEEDSEIGECTRCHTYQNLSDCTKGTMASVVVKPSDGSTLTLCAFEKFCTPLQAPQPKLHQGSFCVPSHLASSSKTSYTPSVDHDLHDLHPISEPYVPRTMTTFNPCNYTTYPDLLLILCNFTYCNLHLISNHYYKCGVLS